MKKIFALLLLITYSSYSYTQKTEKEKLPYKGTYFMLGTGLGISYGGLFGIMAQGRVGNTVGIGVHAGYGYIYDDLNGKAVGVKFFPYKNLYLDVTYGVSGQTTSYRAGRKYTETRYAWTFTAGAEFIWGQKIGHGFSVDIGSAKDMEKDGTYLILPTLNIGLKIANLKPSIFRKNKPPVYIKCI